MAFWAILGAFLLSNAAAIAFTVVSMLYQRRRQKKLAAELDKQKGFDIVTDGEPINLPLVYGYQKVGGVRVYHKTLNSVLQRTQTDSSNWQFFRHPNIDRDWLLNGDKDHTGSKNVFLITQQALCFGGIDSIIDIEVNSQSYNKGKFVHHIAGHINGSAASTSATASGVPETNKFTNTAWLNAMFWLDRNNYNYQGVPNIAAYIKGQRVWDISETSPGVYAIGQRVFSNNNSYVMMDYLLRPKSLGGAGFGELTSEQWLAGTKPSTARINLGSFFRGAAICNTVVETANNVRGRVNGVPPVDRRVATEDDRGSATETGETVYIEDTKSITQWDGSTWDVRESSREIKLYECNITIDTSRPFRDNIELILETMGEAEMVFSEGKYKLILDYPTNNMEQDNLITMTLDDSDIVDEEVNVSYPGASDRLNRVTVKFKNEEHDFVMDSVSWPQWGDANHQRMLSEDSGIESEEEIFFPGCSIRQLAIAKAENMVRQSRVYVGDEITNPGSGYSANRRIIDFTIGRKGMILETGDLIKVSSVTAGIDNLVFRIESIKYTNKMNVKVTASQFNYSNLTYSSKSTEITNPRVIYNDIIPNVINLQYHSGSRQGSSTTSNGYLSWVKPTNYDIRRFVVSVSIDNQNWEELGGTRRRFYDVPTEWDNGQDLYFNVRVQGKDGRLNEGVTIFVDNLQSITPIVTTTVQPITGGIYVGWTEPAPDITRRYNVYYSKTTTKPSTPQLRTKESYINIQPLDVGEIYYIWIDVVGFNGSVGAMVTPLQGTPGAAKVGDITSDDIKGIVDEFSFVNGIQGVKIVSSLPTTGNYEGRLVVLTTDGKLYRYNGGWRRDIPAVDLTGQIQGVQIGNNSISASKLLANSVTSSKIAANAVTAGSIAVGAVTADKIAAGSITAGKLTIGDFNNLWSDPLQSDSSYAIPSGSSVSGSGYSSTSDQRYLSSNVIHVVSLAGQWKAYFNPTVYSVNPLGEQFYVDYVANINSGQSGYAQVELQYSKWEDFRTGADTAGARGPRVNSTVPTRITGVIIIPPGYSYMRIRIVNPDAGSNTRSTFGRVIVYRMNAGELIVDGTIRTNHLAADSVQAGNLAVDAVKARNLKVSENFEVLKNGSFSYGKNGAGDLANDGIYMGRDTAQNGTTGFGFLAGRNADGKQEYISCTKDGGLTLKNAKFLIGTGMSNNSTTTYSRTVNLTSGKSFSFTAVGGGGGGGYKQYSSSTASTGGTTVVTLRNGSTTIKTWSAGGGAGGFTGGSSTATGGDGEISSMSPYGNGGKGQFGQSKTSDDDRHLGGGGGKGGNIISVNNYDISIYSDPKLIITIGSGGSGYTSGSNGAVTSSYVTDAELAAGPISTYPSITGTLTHPGGNLWRDLPLTNPRGGIWVLSPVPANTTINPRGQSPYITTGPVANQAFTFVSFRRPRLQCPSGATINYWYWPIAAEFT